jgi:hypothetical protein
MKQLILSLFLSLVVFSPQAYATSLSCRLAVQEKPGLLPLENEIINSQEVSRRLKLQNLHRSKNLKSELKLGKRSNRWDLIIIGAGPQAVAAALAARGTHLKVLIVDKSDVVASNFAHKEFVINSVETHTLSMHDFPNSKIKLNHFSSTKYASSHQLAAFLQAQVFYSKADVLLRTEVLSLETDSTTGISKLKASGGLNLEAPVLLVATGLGEATTKVRDAKYLELYNQKAKEFETTGELNSVMSTETFMKLVERARRGNKNVAMPKSLALIGNGDGARIVVEELLDSRVQLPNDFKIYWLGNEAKTAEEYVNSQQGWDRYIDRVVPFYKAGIIEALPGHVNAVSEMQSALKIKLDQKDDKGNLIKQVEIDAALIVDSTGYENVGKKLLDKSFPGSTLLMSKVPFLSVKLRTPF